MSTSINQKFTTGSLLKFAMPSIIMMVFMSCYTIIDGIFISRFIGSNALSSLNIVFPVINLVIAIATMLATGGNAIISKLLGQGKTREAREALTQFVVIGVIISLIAVVLTLIFLKPICYFLGSNEILLLDCQIYLKIAILFAPACVLQTLFQSYLVTAGKSTFGLNLIIGAGVLNAILDYVLIVPLQMGIAGAALATGIGQSIPAIAGLVYFINTKKELHFSMFSIHPKTLAMACYNGSSEMIGQLSNAIVTFLFNTIMIRIAGEHGVAAITILLYGQFLFNAFYMGFSIGISPIIGFHYGANHKDELKNVYLISMIFTIISSFILTILSLVAAVPIVTIFTKDAKTFELATVGFRIFAINFLFSGFNIVSSGIFTSLSNGKISAIISFARTLVFLVLSLLLLPQVLGVTGVWLAVPVAEFITIVLCSLMHIRYFFQKGNQNYFMCI